jgi:hypothetical protein
LVIKYFLVASVVAINIFFCCCKWSCNRDFLLASVAATRFFSCKYECNREFLQLKV